MIYTTEIRGAVFIFSGFVPGNSFLTDKFHPKFWSEYLHKSSGQCSLPTGDCE